MAYGVPSIAKAYRSVLAAFTKVEVDGAVRALANVAGQLPARPIVTWGGQTGSERVANLRVVDANDTAATGTFLVLVWVSASEGGAPGGTQTLAVTKGVAVKEIETGLVLVLATDRDGAAQVEVSGAAGSRWIGASVIGGVWGATGVWT